MTEQKIIGEQQDGAVLELETFIPYYIASIANKNISSASQFYLQNFGVGIVEWQAMVVLAIDQQAMAQNIADVAGIDKSAVSRAMKKLIEQKLVSEVKGTFRGRSKPFRLSRSGWDLYHQISAVALLREKRLLAGFSSEEKSCLLGFLKRIQCNTAELIKS